MTHTTDSAVGVATDDVGQADRNGSIEPHPAYRIAWAPITILAGGLLLVGLILNAVYGYTSDELYFLAAGDHLAFGYADQGPAVPLIAHLMQELVPDSSLVLRLPPLLATVAYVVLAALSTRELGGTRTAQSCVAAACVLAPHLLTSSHLLATYSFDQMLWALVLYLLLRWVRCHYSRTRRGNGLLFGAGCATAAAVLVKPLIAALWLVLIPVVAVLGPRGMLRRAGLWAGGALTVLFALPTLLWQGTHGWPLLAMTDIVASETGGSFLPVTFIQLGPAGSVLLVLGLGALLTLRPLRAQRFLGVTALGLTVLFLVLGGRAYYLAGVYPVLFAAGAVLIQRVWQQRDTSRVRGTAQRGVIVTIALVCGVWGSLYAAERIPEIYLRASVGWREITRTVVDEYRSLPGGTARTVVITQDYWSASALHHFGPEYGLSRVYSPSRGFWYFGHPDDAVRRAVYLGSSRQRLSRLFGDVRKIHAIDTDLAVPSYFERTSIWVVSDPELPWPKMWQRLRHMTLR